MELIVIGIARDGHKILGPYNSNGKLWQPCQLDACNGISVNDEYFYVSSMFHPYTVGCWGPSSNDIEYNSICSANSKTCSEE